MIAGIRFKGIDLLPDFLGYILVAIGCRGLTSVSRHFTTASTMCWFLAVFSLVGYAARGDAARLFSLANLAIDCAMIWFLLGGVMELAIARQRLDISEQASKRRVAYVVLMGFATLAGFVKWNNWEAAIMLVVWIICILLVLFLILHLIHKAKYELTHDNAT